MSLIKAWRWLATMLVLVAVLAGCGDQAESGPSPADALPGTEEVPGWNRVGDVQGYDADNLYDLVNGQADAYFAYEFEQVAVGVYENTDGIQLRVEVWQLATPFHAYGLFTSIRSGTPVAIPGDSTEGQPGDGDAGRRLDFWQNRYLVRIFALQPVSDPDLQAFAGAVSAALPPGAPLPELVRGLPAEGLTPDSELFFHQEISLQNYLWLGGQNLLGLGPETTGVWVRYELEDGPANLLLVEYPGADAAQAALAALQAGPPDNLVAARIKDDRLGVVFGATSAANAGALLTDALDGQ
ncbi:MAG: hypothetical protein PVH11_01620 [Anaerolineae bacterium]|jgi:hypothetical protein